MANPPEPPRRDAATADAPRAASPPLPRSATFLPGDVVQGRFRIVRFVARGGMGEVYEATDLELRERVALKTVAYEIAHVGATLDRFLREIQLARQVTHPNVCRTYDFGRHVLPSGGEVTFVTMEFLEGETLGALLERKGALSEEDALPLVRQIAAGLGAAHDAGVVHRDFKPDNVLLVSRGEGTRVVVTDFGVARRPGESSVTDTGAMVGTPEYMAPEQVTGGDVTPATDVYALGAVIYEMVTAHRPFVAETPVATALLRLQRAPASPRVHVPGLDPEWDAAILRCLERGPQERFARVTDVVRALEGLGPARPATPTVVRSGTRLGAYTLGAATPGAADLWTARDADGGAAVLLRLLPPSIASSPDALARCDREARAIRALSDPRLVAPSGFGRSDGLAYAVLEAAPGDTLRARLARGPLPPRDASALATRVADALAALHDAGLADGSLAAETILLRPDGTVALLDLALGGRATASPEQARGGRADARSDVFALGALLLEMLGGRPPFERATEAATRRALVDDAPPGLPSRVPPGLARVAARCLEKAPGARFQSARDVAFVLSGLPNDASARRLALVAGGLLLLGIAAGAVAGRVGWPRDAAPPSWRSVTQLTDSPGIEESPVLAADGKTVYFVGRQGENADVYVQRIGGHNPTDLTPDCAKPDTAPALSRDGERIAYRSECGDPGLYVMGATGEAKRRLADGGYDPSWAPDGRSIAVGTELSGDPSIRALGVAGIEIVDALSGARRRLAMDVDDAMQPAWSPHGTRIAFWGMRGKNGESGERDVWTVGAAGGHAEPVTSDAALDFGPAWSGDGRLLYFCSTRGGTMNVWRVAIDEATGKLLGAPEPLGLPALAVGRASLAADGRLAYATRSAQSRLYVARLDLGRGVLEGGERPVFSGSGAMVALGLSADGSTVVFRAGSQGENLFLVGTDGSRYRQITDEATLHRNPIWSPDGSRIAFVTTRDGGYKIWAVRPDGSGLEQLTRDEGYAPAWSPDGRRLSAVGNGHSYIVDLTQPLAQRAPRDLPLLPTGQPFWITSWARDGSYLAGHPTADRNAPGGVYVLDLASLQYDRVAERGANPFFLSDLRHLLYWDDGGLVLVDRVSREARTVLPRGTITDRLNSFGVSADDRTVAYFRTETDGDLWMAAAPPPR